MELSFKVIFLDDFSWLKVKKMEEFMGCFVSVLWRKLKSVFGVVLGMEEAGVCVRKWQKKQNEEES